MKRLLLTGLLICGLTALVSGGEGMRSGQQEVTVTRTFVAADTAINKPHWDTVYSDPVDISEYTRIQFYAQILSDTSFLGDTLTVRLQVSPNLPTPDWQYFDDSLFIVLLSNDTGFYSLIHSLDTIPLLADRMRFECVRHDSNEATQPGLLGNSYDADFIIRFKGWK